MFLVIVKESNHITLDIDVLFSLTSVANYIKLFIHLKGICLIVISVSYTHLPLKLSCELAVWGLIAGELASNLFNICSLCLLYTSRCV